MVEDVEKRVVFPNEVEVIHTITGPFVEARALLLVDAVGNRHKPIALIFFAHVVEDQESVIAKLSGFLFGDLVFETT